MSRLTPITKSEMTAEQLEQFERIAKLRRADDQDQFGGPFDPWIRSPEVARRAMGFGNFIWLRTQLDRGLVELAIIITARHWRSNVEWVAHARLAKENGIADNVIESVFNEHMPDTDDEAIRTIYAFTRALHETKDVPLEIYQQAVQLFSEQGVVDLIATIGYYTFVSMTLNTFNIPTAAGQPTPFPRDGE